MRLKFLAVLVWTLFNIALGSWWFVYGWRLTAPEEITHQLMLRSEAIVLLLSLVMGGAALLYFIKKEAKKSLEVRTFFAAFSHELKTSIASLRLQVESLAEDLNEGLGDQSNPLISRLINDSVQLEIQLENALALSRLESVKLYFEPIRIHKIIDSFRHHWPQIEFDANHDLLVFGDQRVLETVFRNLAQNSILHGHAKKISYQQEVVGAKQCVLITDDGLGFHGRKADLGKLFYRHCPQSGSGVGLYLVNTLLDKMGARVEFPQIEKGFQVRIEFKKMQGDIHA